MEQTTDTGSGSGLQGGCTEEELRQTIARLQKEKLKAEAIIAAIGDGIIVVDTDRKITYQNQISLESIGNRMDEYCHIVFAGRDTACEDCYMESCFEGSIQTVEKSYIMQGRAMHFEITVSPMRDGDGRIIAGIKVIRNIGDRKQTEEQLRYLSNHDVLTGLYNRTFFEENLNRLERGKRYPISIVMADVDDLKAVNDRLGHAAGDVLLRQAAVLFSEVFRSEDIVARIGGDEFAVLLPDTGELAAEALVGRIRQSLSSWNENHCSAVDLSIGVAVAANGGELRQALRIADQRMYHDKITRTGRPPRRSF